MYLKMRPSFILIWPILGLLFITSAESRSSSCSITKDRFGPSGDTVDLKDNWNLVKQLNNSIYNSTIDLKSPPIVFNKSIVIEMGLIIKKVNTIDDKENTFVLDVQMTEAWFDRRFNLSQKSVVSISVVGKNMERLWTPATVYDNLHKGTTAKFLSDYRFMVIANNGFVLRRSRVLVKLLCNMNLEGYPYDRQRCFIRIKELQHLQGTVRYKPCTERSFDVERLTSERFKMSVRNVTETCSLSRIEEMIWEKGDRVCLEVELLFERKSVRYALIKSLPSMALVAIAFCSFLVPITEHATRLTLLLIPMTCLTLMNETFVSATCTVAANVWFTGCTLFVGCCFLQYLIAFYSVRYIQIAIVQRLREYEGVVQDPEADREEDEKPQDLPPLLVTKVPLIGSPATDKKDVDKHKATVGGSGGAARSGPVLSHIPREKVKEKPKERVDNKLPSLLMSEKSEDLSHVTESISTEKPSTGGGSPVHELPKDALLDKSQQKLEQDKEQKEPRSGDGKAKTETQDQAQGEDRMEVRSALNSEAVTSVPVADAKKSEKKEKKPGSVGNMRTQRKSQRKAKMDLKGKVDTRNRLELMHTISYIPADTCSRIAFPVFFALYAYFYWLVYIM